MVRAIDVGCWVQRVILSDLAIQLRAITSSIGSSDENNSSSSDVPLPLGLF